MTSLKTQFSINPPDRVCLAQILGSVQWDATDKDIDLMIKHLPHPSLLPMWASLVNGEVLVGFATLYLPPPQSLQLAPVFVGNFVIDSALHRKGLGSFLLREIELWCKQMGIGSLALQTLETSTAFFLSKGFVRNEQHADILFKTLN